MIVEFTAEATRDLEQIADRIALDNPARSLTFIRELRTACLGLADFPDRFPLVPRYQASGVRHRVHGNYLIFYRVEGERVVVLHIRHGAMDYAGHLGEERGILGPSARDTKECAHICKELLFLRFTKRLDAGSGNVRTDGSGSDRRTNARRRNCVHEIHHAHAQNS